MSWLAQIFYGKVYSEISHSDRHELNELLHAHVLDDNVLAEIEHSTGASEEV
jgi:hypothetical protein